jgi:hypothetical protein
MLHLNIKINNVEEEEEKKEEEEEEEEEEENNTFHSIYADARDLTYI